MNEKPAAYLWTLDNTEGIPGNRAPVVLTLRKVNPFGRPGIDYSRSFPVTCEPLYRRASSASGGPT